MPRSKQHFDISLSLDEFLARLRAETVAYKDNINMSDPLGGYKNYLVASVTGSKHVVSQIDHHSFNLMPIGISPAKGQSALASAGCLEGAVVATESGSHMSTRYRFAITLVLINAVFGLASIGMVAIAVFATVWNPPAEGLLLLQTLAVASCFVKAYFAEYLWLGGRTQSKQVTVFLEKLLEGTQTTQVTDSSRPRNPPESF